MVYYVSVSGRVYETKPRRPETHPVHYDEKRGVWWTEVTVVDEYGRRRPWILEFHSFEEAKKAAIEELRARRAWERRIWREPWTMREMRERMRGLGEPDEAVLHTERVTPELLEDLRMAAYSEPGSRAHRIFWTIVMDNFGWDFNLDPERALDAISRLKEIKLRSYYGLR